MSIGAQLHWRLPQAYTPQVPTAPRLRKAVEAGEQGPYGKGGGYRQDYNADVAAFLIQTGKMSLDEHDCWKNQGRLHDRFSPIISWDGKLRDNLPEHAKRLPVVEQNAGLTNPMVKALGGLGLAQLAFADGSTLERNHITLDVK